VRDLKEGEGTYYLSRFSGSGRVHAARRCSLMCCVFGLSVFVLFLLPNATCVSGHRVKQHGKS
jgi:hypothetical protein